ncbi:hypothetical protein [Spongorhabdus nitratireducens]
MSEQLLEKLKQENRALKAELKALQADNPKRLKEQNKRLQAQNRGKDAELNQLKQNLKKVTKERDDFNAVLDDLGALATPQWLSEDKSWAIYLSRPEFTGEELADDELHLKIVDLKTGGAKVVHVDETENGNEVSWPRMRTVPKNVKDEVNKIVAEISWS